MAPGVNYPAWAYNGQVPGPTLRATEGDRLRVVFRNRGAHPHTIHFHGFHPALSASNLGGFVVGVAIMYATALLVSV